MTQTLNPALRAPDSADALLPTFEIHDPTSGSINPLDFTPPAKALAVAVPSMCLTDEEGFHESLDWFRSIADTAEHLLQGTGTSVFAPVESFERL